MRRTVRGFLFLVVGAALVLALGVMGLILNDQLARHLLAEKEGELARVAADLARLAVKDYDPEAETEVQSPPAFPRRMDAWAKDMGELGGYRVSLIDADGRLYGDSLVPEESLKDAEPHGLRPEVRAAFLTGRGRSRRLSGTLGREYLYAAVRVDYAAAPPRVLRVGVALDSLDRVRHRILGAYGLVALLGLGLGLLATWAGTRRLTGSIREIAGAARDLAAGELGRRVRGQPANELGDIGRALNLLAERLSGQLRLAEANLNHLLAVLEAMDEGVLVLDETGEPLRANRQLLALLGLGELRAESLRRSELAEDLETIRRGEQPAPRMIHDHGPPERFLEARFSPVAGPGGGTVAVFHDLTARQRLYQMRREFVANISHELRTPLTAIMGAAETLRDRLEGAPEAGPLLDVLDRQTRRLNELARDLLELARLEEVKVQPLRRERLSVADLLAEIPGRVSAGAEAGGRFAVDVEDEDLEIFGDRAALAGALVNLADNALKYGAPEGMIALRGRRRGGLVELVVVNQGPTIAPEDRERIFERFYRGEKGRRSGRGGTGLGLAIVKHVARVHGGRVSLECPPEGGAVFTISLPAD